MTKYADAASFAAALEPLGADPRRDRAGPWWSARCPHPDHQDDTPSMRFRDGDSALIVHCFGCSPNGDKPKWLSAVMEMVESGEQLPPSAPSKRRGGGGGGPLGPVVATYDYRDADGTVVARKRRHDPKTFTWQRPYNAEAWIDGLGGTTLADLPPYRLPELLALPAGSVVWFTEGEKDADRIAAAGAAATCSGGSGVVPRDLSPFAGHRVRVCIDNDQAGHKHALAVGGALTGIAASVRYVAGLVQDKGADVTDHLDAGYRLDDMLLVERHGDQLRRARRDPDLTGLTVPDGFPGGEPSEELTGLTVPDGFPGGGSALSHCLELVQEFLSRFLVLPDEHAAVAITLWVAHAHAIDSWESTPRLALMSPEKRCGKTRVQEVVATMVPVPMRTSDVTPAVLYRSIAEDPRPTVFIDEVDTIWTGKGINEELRALVNAGHRRGVDTRRMVGEGAKMAVASFRTFAAVCLAGIGDLPDTIADRSVSIAMRRRLAGEEVERWRSRIHEPQGQEIAGMLSAAILPFADHLAEAYPELPDQVEDRAGDVWEPLLAVADAAGGHWPAAARASCLAITAGVDESLSVGVRLLTDIRDVWPDSLGRLATNHLLKLLHDLEDGPWGPAEGRPALTGRRLAYLLKPYRVKPRSDGEIRGYLRDDLADPWRRYCPAPPSRTRQEASEPSERNPR